MMVDDLSTVDTFGQRLRRLRMMQGHSQRQFARLTGIHYSEICKLERDRAPGMTVSRLQRLARTLGVTTSELLGEVPLQAEWPKE